MYKFIHYSKNNKKYTYIGNKSINESTLPNNAYIPPVIATPSNHTQSQNNLFASLPCLDGATQLDSSAVAASASSSAVAPSASSLPLRPPLSQIIATEAAHAQIPPGINVACDGVYHTASHLDKNQFLRQIIHQHFNRHNMRKLCHEAKIHRGILHLLFNHYPFHHVINHLIDQM